MKKCGECDGLAFFSVVAIMTNPSTIFGGKDTKIFNVLMIFFVKTRRRSFHSLEESLATLVRGDARFARSGRGSLRSFGETLTAFVRGDAHCVRSDIRLSSPRLSVSTSTRQCTSPRLLEVHDLPSKRISTEYQCVTKNLASKPRFLIF